MLRTNMRGWLLVVTLQLAGCNVVAGILAGRPDGLDFCTDKPSGTPLLDQEQGDCKVVVCDADGFAKIVAALDDNDDGNPCTQDTCINGEPVHTARNEPIACYTGPWGTKDVGVCHGGMQQCANGQPVGVCENEQVPQVEQCADPFLAEDEDCDGLLDEEGDNCECGDGVVQVPLGEACDDGNDDPTDRCTTKCLPAKCGDGFLFAGQEECDDGNLVDMDLCSADCRKPICGNGQREGGEACDDGNTLDGDGCPADCRQDIEQLAVGGGHTCVLFVDGRIKCWGNNAAGQLGIGDTNARGDEPDEMGHRLPVVDLGMNAMAKAIAAGQQHTCALLEGGAIKCWGYGGHGELGLGNRQNRGDDAGEMGEDLPVIDIGTDGQGKPAKAVAIAAGAFHTCALREQGDVKCWGFNGAGQLGVGDTESRGDGANEMGDDLAAVTLGSGKTATGIAAGRYHTCALLNDGSVKCWGFNMYGQLGLGDSFSRGDEANETGDNLPAVDLGTGKTASSIVTGGGYTCVLRTDGLLVCWGAGSRGQNGTGLPDSIGDEPNEMGDKLTAIDLGLGATIQTVSAGGSHLCARIQNDSVKCWGANDTGQLGLENTEDRGAMSGEMSDNLLPVNLGTNVIPLVVVAGHAHTCSVVTGAAVKCWGSNFHGQIGLGNTSSAPGADKLTMGDFLLGVPLW